MNTYYVLVTKAVKMSGTELFALGTQKNWSWTASVAIL